MGGIRLIVNVMIAATFMKNITEYGQKKFNNKQNGIKKDCLT